MKPSKFVLLRVTARLFYYSDPRQYLFTAQALAYYFSGKNS